MMLKSQSEIMKKWNNSDHIVVSICTLTYNHEDFIRDCIEGILMQETDFAFELLIHDDASTDNTQQIIQEYVCKYPLIIKPIYQNENQHSQGINPSVTYNYPRAHGDYVAWCEGDDYWTDKNKLAIQVQAMQENPQCHLSFHKAMQIDYSDSNIPDEIIGVYANKNQIIQFEDIIHWYEGMIPTASCLVTQKVKKELLHFQKDRNYLTIGDRYMQFFGARNGGAFYINKTMSVYRIATKSSWTRQIRQNVEKQIQYQFSVIKSYKELNNITSQKYKKEFMFLIAHRIYQLGLIHMQNSIKTYSHLYSDFYKKLSIEIAALNNSDNNYIIYGAGTGASYLLTILDKQKVSYFIDKNKNKNKFCGKDIIHISKIPKLQNQKIIISLFGRSRSVIRDLTQVYNIDTRDIISFDNALVAAFNNTATDI